MYVELRAWLGFKIFQDVSICVTTFTTFICVGVSLIAASGDNGANSADVARSISSCSLSYDPQFPASSPYVTAVGATQVLKCIYFYYVRTSKQTFKPMFSYISCIQVCMGS